MQPKHQRRIATSPGSEHVINRPALRLVIVDDHTFIRDLMVRMLAQQRGRYDVVAAVGTAAEAIAACGENKPDLLILDINLPDQNGIDALAELRRVAPATRVLLSTGFPNVFRSAELAGIGVHGFVQKTNTWDEFLQAIEKVSRGEYYFSSDNVETAEKSARLQEADPSSAG